MWFPPKLSPASSSRNSAAATGDVAAPSEAAEPGEGSEPAGYGTAVDGMSPSTRSQDPRTNASGVPTSSQYALSGYPITRASAAISSGNVSCSTDTTRPGGIWSMTERRNT